MQSASVSVVIPAYNCERYVGHAIRSVLAQTLPPAEVIVVDDGSTDSTAAAVRAFEPRVKYLRQENRGEPAARNLGIRHAAGEFIAFLDADDLWSSEKLARQMDYFRRHPDCALVYTDMATFDERGTIDPSVKERFHISFPEGNIFPQLFRETLFGSGSVLVRKQVFDQVGLFDEELLVGCDYEMWLRIARRFQVGLIDQPLLQYRQHSSMSTRNLGTLLHHGMPWEVVVLKKTLARYPAVIEELGAKAVNRRLAYPYACLGQIMLQQGQHSQARSMFAQAIRLAPGNCNCWLLYLASLFTPAQLSTLKKLLRRPRMPQPAGQPRAGTLA